MKKQLFTLPDRTVISMQNIDFIGPVEKPYSDYYFWIHMKSGQKTCCREVAGGGYANAVFSDDVKKCHTRLIQEWEEFLTPPEINITVGLPNQYNQKPEL